MTYVGFWKRVVAGLIDLVIVVGVMFLIGFCYGWYIASQNAGLIPRDMLTEYANQVRVIGFFIYWIFSSLMESSKYQGTPGKIWLKMKVVDKHGKRISFWRATVRFYSKILSEIILFIGFIMVAFTQKKQGLHDYIAHTFVIEK